jgi:hypothetical protein
MSARLTSSAAWVSEMPRWCPPQVVGGAAPGIAEGVARLRQLVPPPPVEDDDAPVFLLAAGWRSGSTLLQRCLLSDGRLLMWGEPYQESGLIQAMAHSARAFRHGWPDPKWFYDGTPPVTLTNRWVANLFPPPGDWRLAQRALLDAAFASPARRSGASRWGIKEVRWTSAVAGYLRWLYPKCKLVFLYRNPWDAYRSYCRRGGSWYNTFPNQPVFSARTFGQHRASLTAGFLRDAEELGAHVLRYEQLTAGRDWISALERHLDLCIDASVLDQHLTGDPEAPAYRVPVVSRWILSRAVSPLAQSLGYAP